MESRLHQITCKDQETNELKKELAALKGEPEPELLNTNIAQSEMAGKLKEILANKN